MIIRNIERKDYKTLQEINSRCHPNDTFPGFNKFHPPVVVITDNKDRVITAGGVERIAEAVTITDNKFSSHVRTTALQKLLESMLLTCKRVDYDCLHAFLDGNDEAWVKAIHKVGFKPVGKSAFFLGVNHG